MDNSLYLLFCSSKFCLPVSSLVCSRKFAAVSLSSLTFIPSGSQKLSPKFPLSNSLNYPTFQHQQTLAGNIPGGQAREIGKPNVDLHNSLLPSKSKTLVSSFILQQNTRYSTPSSQPTCPIGPTRPSCPGLPTHIYHIIPPPNYSRYPLLSHRTILPENQVGYLHISFLSVDPDQIPWFYLQFCIRTLWQPSLPLFPSPVYPSYISHLSPLPQLCFITVT